MSRHKLQRLLLLLTGLIFFLSAPLNAALLMHLPLDNNLNDISGNSNNGNMPGGSSNPSYTAAVFNKGLNFDGNNDYITIPSFDPGSTFSASLWVNHDNIGALNTFIEHVNNGNNRNDFYIGYDNSNNSLTVELEDNNSTEGGACGDPKFCTGIVLQDSRWYHLVVTVTPTTLKVYVDSVLAYNMTHSTAVNFGNGTWMIGGDTDSNPVTSASTDYLDGRIDDMRIYNHELTQIEISTLYGLVGNWTADDCNMSAAGDIKDSSGNALHASPVNGTTTVAGRICTALSFDGTDDYAEVADNTLLDLNTSLTVMTWIRPGSLPASDLMTIISKDENFEFHINPAGNIFWWWNNSSGATRQIISTVTVPINTWSHVAIVYESGSQRILINGVERGTTAYNEMLLTNNDPLQIGTDQLYAGRNFDGLIDEIQIYNRALSTEEINGYYTNPDPLSRTCTTCTATATCTITNTTSQEELKGISGSSDSNIIAAGKKGEIYIYNGSSWTGPVSISGNPNEDLEDVSVINSTSSVIVGDKGTVFVQNNNVWSVLTTPNTEDLKGVWAYSPSDFYVFGKKGTVYHYNNGSWNDLSATTNNKDFEGAWGDTNAVYGLTKKGVIHTFTRPANTPSSNNTCDAASGDDFKSIWGDGTGSFYLAGKKGQIRKFDGASNCPLVATASEDLEGIYGSTVTGDIYAVGDKGVLIKNGSPSWIESTVSNGEDLKAVWVSDTGTPYYAGKKGTITVCTIPPSLHHIEFVHDGSALTCNSKEITVKACENASCSALSSTATTVGLSPTGWVGGDSVTFTGSTNYSLKHTVAETITLSTTSVTPVVSSSLVCKTAGGTVIDPCNIIFSDSGFIFRNDTDSVSVTTSNTTIPVQLSGKPSNIGYNTKDVSLRAVQKSATDPTQCAPAFQNKTLNVDFAAECINPSTCISGQLFNLTSGAVTGNLTATTDNNSVVGTSSSYDTRSITFDADGKANIIFNYPEAGMIELHARHNILQADGTTPSGNFMTGSSSFVVRPLGFSVDFSGQRAADYADDGTLNNSTTTNLSYAADSSGSVFKKAGEDFVTTLTAVQWQAADDTNNDGIPDVGANLTNNSTTQNFGNETTAVIPANLTSSHTVTLVPNVGSLANSANSAGFSNGVATKTYAWSEVGILNLSTSLTNYLTTGGNISGTAQNVGRFTPDHFCIGANAIFNRTDSNTASACTNNFTFLDEDFDSIFTLTAQAMGGNCISADITQNYSGLWSKFSTPFTEDTSNATESGKWNIAAVNDLSGTPVDLSSRVDINIIDSSPTNGLFSDGQLIVSARIDIDRSGSAPGFTAEASLSDVHIGINPIDTDGIGLATTNLVINTANYFDTGTTTLYFGRLYADNAFGSELTALSMWVQTQYCDSVSAGSCTDWLNISNDSCTLFSVLPPVDTSIGGIIAGDGTGYYKRPGDMVSGVTPEYDFNSATGRLYTPDTNNHNSGFNLFYTAGGTGGNYTIPFATHSYLTNQAGIASFGLYRGDDRIIYWREVFD